jgi:hypothetical protein
VELQSVVANGYQAQIPPVFAINAFAHATLQIYGARNTEAGCSASLCVVKPQTHEDQHHANQLRVE